MGSNDSTIFTPLEDEELEIKRRGLEISHESSAENAFSVIKVTESEKHDILFIKSALPVL